MCAGCCRIRIVYAIVKLVLTQTHCGLKFNQWRHIQPSSLHFTSVQFGAVGLIIGLGLGLFSFIQAVASSGRLSRGLRHMYVSRACFPPVVVFRASRIRISSQTFFLSVIDERYQCEFSPDFPICIYRNCVYIPLTQTVIKLLPEWYLWTQQNKTTKVLFMFSF